MSLQQKFLVGVLVLAGFFSMHFDSRAQGFGLGATASPDPVLVNNPVLYSINVTNFTNVTLNNVFVTNAISGEANFNINSASNSLGGTVTSGSDGIVFRNFTMFVGQSARLTFSLSPTETGPFTNEITVTALGQTNVTTNVVTNVVTQVNFPTADLAVGMTNVMTGVLTNDTTVIGLFATNLGPSAAASVVVTNSLPASFTLLSVSPAAVSNTFTGGNLVLHLGTLASGVATQLLVTVRPTSAGTNNLTASVTGNVNDTNAANNVVTKDMVVGTFQGNLEVVVVSNRFNLQTGLLEQRVRVTNTNATNVDAARVIASGLPNGARLYNASGTNSGNAYVHYNSALATGGFVNLVLEFYVLQVSTFTNTLAGFGVPAINLTAPTTTGPSITLKAHSSGGYLIEFPATIGRTYTIVYGDGPFLTNAMVAQPSIVAPATQVQWIDNGPPKTISHPSNTVQRYYRVLESP